MYLLKKLAIKLYFSESLWKAGQNTASEFMLLKWQVCRLKIIERADEILKQLEKSHSKLKKYQTAKIYNSHNHGNYQLSFIQLDDPLLEQIKEDIMNTNINTLTPVEALMKLNEIKSLLSKRKK